MVIICFLLVGLEMTVTVLLIAIIYQFYLGREENKLMRIQQQEDVLPYLEFWRTQNNKELSLMMIGN